jgi:hypothetical protein
MQLLVVALIFALGGTQEKAQEAYSEPKRGDTIVVRGCITGGKIESSETQVRDKRGTYPVLVTYRLTGEKKALKQIKEDHDGHADVITGVLKSDLPNQNAPGGKRIGNTRVVIGEPPRTDPHAPQFLPALQVKKIDHTGINCGG